ncbi:DNA alkylation repair protein [Pendulispora rubella]|uniref:DNA alkylation repair protein n=1 Tax=Pendulispora rubella TaxID=2741070 RepID=A0ABZ2KTH7_9BACT
MDGSVAVRFFRSRFRSAGDIERAHYEKKYLKSALDFHGVNLPFVRKAAAEFVRAHELDAASLRSVTEALFDTNFHDLRSAGIAVLERRRELLALGDVPWLLELVRKSPGWAHVDWLAIKVIGPTVQNQRTMPRLLRTWSRDEDFWVRRTALLAQHDALRAGGGDFGLFEEMATPLLDETEFFIRKAIGWVLRETSKKSPDLVRAFVAKHRERMSGLTLREASKYI